MEEGNRCLLLFTITLPIFKLYACILWIKIQIELKIKQKRMKNKQFLSILNLTYTYRVFSLTDKKKKRHS